MPKPSTEFSPRDKLVSATRAFCDDLANKAIERLLSHFSTTFGTSVIEHGDPGLAPYLGRPFTSPQAYLELISSLLDYKDMKFNEDMIADASNSKVSIQGRAEFTWKETGKSWKEQFLYVLDFDDGYKVTDWSIWSDTGAAYLASMHNA